MKIVHSLLLNLLIGLVIFILFFLVFEQVIVVPPALQVLGRAHPLLLHFPIVLLVLSWLLACFGDRFSLPRHIVTRLVYAFLFVSAWTAAVTVLAGLVLAQEGGYDGNGFQWHKWMGVALCLLAILLLMYHRYTIGATGRYHVFFRAGLTVSLVVLMVAGHFGAALTHGDNYLFEPLRRNRQPALDVATAVVFPDVVYPILKAKCLNCHSSSKAKGGLVLADTTSLMQGGDSGPVLVKGSVTESLLIERLLLDLDHEHRMPPKGKPQLTADELALINAWVASGADFNIALAALPADDTIRRLAEAIYPVAEDTYDFPAADADVIKSLNTPYRLVRPLAQSSPALSVSFFGKSFYTEESLQALAQVDQQVVSLTLSGIPLVAGDRNTLASFINLRELTLNGTPVDDTWADMLSSLPKLHTLRVSSTALTEAGLTTLLSAPTLRSVYVWNTAVDSAAVGRLQREYAHVRIEQGYIDNGETVLPLNDPVIAPSTKFFRDSLWVTLSHPVPGVVLHYTIDGSEPDSLIAPVYKEPFLITDITPIRVKGYKPGWMSSREIARTFHRSGRVPSVVSLLTSPDSRYSGRGGYTLHNLESGGANHADGKWLGFYGEPMMAVLSFDTATDIHTVGISIKQDYGSHIYPPQHVRLWGGADSADARLLTESRPDLSAAALPTRMVEIPVIARNIRYLRVEARPYVPIPEGYPAAGNPSWVFIDEIIVR
ncbi:c-type cytochrome domain-containing protein [Parapedobacter sp. 10938]|uniref:c-type cytochrome domain-containing protein n=1 Tax=Parapedobacter flavus TaxID=3110225 RepID=UPI002DBD16C3|nr:c-type cytochrome domain-containing protein [Parapedobacter sp. 10938]MEC3881360.1 c-type cytochrome domain-containing protein [Parapedobacter sp. 10938]